MGDGERSIPRPPPQRPRPEEARLAFGGVRYEVWQWDQPLFDGTVTTFEVLRGPDTALVLPVTSQGLVLLAEVDQPGMPPQLRALGGKVEEGERPDTAARRELFEEAGCVADELVLFDAWQSQRDVDAATFLFVARGARAVASRVGDAGERVTVRRVPVSELLDPSSDLRVTHYDLQHRLLMVRCDELERERFVRLLTPSCAPPAAGTV